MNILAALSRVIIALLGLLFLGAVALTYFLATLQGERHSSPNPDEQGKLRQFTFETTTPPGREPKKQWVFRVPNEFVASVTGSRVFGWAHRVTLHAMLNLETMEIKENLRAVTPGSKPWTYFGLNLEEKRGIDADQGRNDICRDDEDGRRNWERPPRTGQYPPIRDCTTANCTYRMTFEGWSVNVSVSREIYLEKERMCSFATELLRNWTVKVDNLLN